MATEIPFRREFAFRYGEAENLSPLVRRVVARNASPFTFKGTGTYIVGRGKVAIIDPGPAMDDHVAAVLDAVAHETVTHIVVTHTHLDHSPAAAAVKQATGARSFGFGPHGAGRVEDHAGIEIGVVEEGGDRDFRPDVALRDGDTLDGPGWSLTAIETPGHTSNHLCFALAEEKLLFTGDHVMGWSTSVIASPDGDMGAYLRSLDKLLARNDARYWPTHGPSIDDPKPYVRAFIAHRRERSDAILARLKAGDRTIPEIVAKVYAGLDPRLTTAAGRSVLAHLIEMIERGVAASDGPPSPTGRFRPRW
ncbi:MAG TPA: MBL fold metallo-hydrolase [Stellaceae bacterium]|nr:MBL fold metallo-hydrolase [Stellaceae bacterium]